MLTPHCRLTVIATALLIGGCAPLEWHKPGTSAEEQQRDVDRCSAQARREALTRLPPMAGLPQIVVDRDGRAINTRSTPPDSERFFLEQDLLRQCLRQLGYTLREPAPAPATPESSQKP